MTMKRRFVLVTVGVLALSALVPVWAQRERERERATTPEGMARSIMSDLREARGLVVRLLPAGPPPARNREREPEADGRGNSEGRGPNDRRRLEFLLERAERTARDLEFLESEITRIRGGDSVNRPPVPAPIQPLSDEEFDVVLKTVKAKFFSNEKQDYLRSVARKSYFDCRQLEQLVEDAFATRDRMETMYIIYPRLVDKERAYTLEKKFVLSADWKEVCEKLGIVKP